MLKNIFVHRTTLFYSGGDAGAETITWDDAGDSLYLMSVYDYSHSPSTHIVQSEARIALYANNSGSPVTMEVPTTETNTYSRSKGFLPFLQCDMILSSVGGSSVAWMACMVSHHSPQLIFSQKLTPAQAFVFRHIYDLRFFSKFVQYIILIKKHALYEFSQINISFKRFFTICHVDMDNIQHVWMISPHTIITEMNPCLLTE